jgi:hypothetical protein
MKTGILLLKEASKIHPPSEVDKRYNGLQPWEKMP